MESLFLAAYGVLTVLAIAQSLLLGLQAWEHRRYVRSYMRRLGRHQPTGHAAVFAPCKGIDVELENNLRGLLRQDYDDYEVTFVVETAADPAVEVIRRVIAEHPCSAARLVIAGRSSKTGQKVHNLRAATAGFSPRTKYLAFVDSDARPRPEWLRVLIQSLQDSEVGAVTGYRWFVPARRSLANLLAYSINCGIMSLFGKNNHYLVWGGSWGIRRDVFDMLGMREAWRRTLSDDLVASRELRRAGCRVRFDPGCVVASPVDYSTIQMFGFLRRQYLVGRFYVRNWWTFALAFSTLTNFAWLGTLLAVAYGLMLGTPPLWFPASVGTILYLLSVHRGWLRQSLLRIYFPGRGAAFRGPALFDIWLNPLVGFVNWLGLLGSSFGRYVVWRGVRYRLFLGGRIRMVERFDESQPKNHPQQQQMLYNPPVKVEPLPSYRKAG